MYPLIYSPASVGGFLCADDSEYEAARIAALQDHRSVASLMEILIRRHCETVDISIPEQQSLFNGDTHE